MVLVKRGKIFHLFILRKIEHENVIDDILDRKKAFPDYKNIKNLLFFFASEIYNNWRKK